MPKPLPDSRSSLRGLSRLTIDAIAEVTHLVEAMHHTILRTPGILGKATIGPTKGITGLVYRSIRGVNTLVGSTLDVVLERVDPLLGERSAAPATELALAALNGVLGDYLAETQNPLAIAMSLRADGHPLQLEVEALRSAFPQPTDKLVVLAHGLCMNDLQWSRPVAGRGQTLVDDTDQRSDLSSLLARDLGYTPVHLHYNSGRHISSNGREFADLLETLVRQWPLPVRELVIVGHSMGGLVSRSACHYGAEAEHVWLQRLRSLVFLGTPHHGAPLERSGNWVDVMLGVSPYTAPFARLGKIRSAGITDLRYGNLIDEDWTGRDRFARSGDLRRSLPLPADAQCYVIAATTQKAFLDPRDQTLIDRLGDNQARGNDLRGDGLVPVRSALGHHDNPALSLAIPESRQWIGYGMNHLDLLTHPAVHEQIGSWLTRQATRTF